MGSYRLLNLIDQVKHAELKTRLKWCEQLIYKLELIHDKFNIVSNLTLSKLKIDLSDDLIITNVEFKDQKNINDLQYKAPEYFFGYKDNNKSSDVWRAGICVFYICFLKFPWKKASIIDKQYLMWVYQNKLPCDDDNIDLDALKSMLCVDFKTRPNVKEIIQVSLDFGPNLQVVSEFIVYYSLLVPKYTKRQHNLIYIKILIDTSIYKCVTGLFKLKVLKYMLK